MSLISSLPTNDKSKRNLNSWWRWQAIAVVVQHGHLLKIRFGKIITIHGAENNICKCFSKCNRTFTLEWYSHLSKTCAYWMLYTWIAHFCKVSVWSKWLKFTMSYIPIQSFVVGINVAIQLWVGFFFPMVVVVVVIIVVFLFPWASFHLWCLHMCDKHSTKTIN